MLNTPGKNLIQDNGLAGSKPPLPGFEQFSRYWLSRFNSVAVQVKPGEFYVTANPEALTTVLGSCIAVCIRDPKAGVGGINHFMLPYSDSESDHIMSSARYGAFAMEQLINEIMKAGGNRSNLEVKVTGGGNMIPGMYDIGAQNIKFIQDYLECEGLSVMAADLGGSQPRSVIYFPREGRMLIKKLASMHKDRVLATEGQHKKRIASKPIGGDVELF